LFYFGVPCPPHTSTEAAIDSFAATTCCLGIRRTGDDPNPVLAPRDVYETKTRRWREHWPELTVLPWPDGVRQ
jgi:uncharacterized protein